MLLLGAGASKAYGKSPTGQRMPVARDFFETYLELDIAANPWVLIEGLMGYLRERDGLADPIAYLTSGVDIEALHSEIEARRDELMAGPAARFPDYFFEMRAFNELVYLFASVLNEVQNGPISDAHVALARTLQPEDAVITFNWDTLMDRALVEATQWRPDWGYGALPRRIFRDGWVDPERPGSMSSLALLKLHGSSNWLTAHPGREHDGTDFFHTHDLEPDAFAVFEIATKPYDCFAGRYMAGYQPFAYGYYPPNLDFEGRAAPPGYAFMRIRPKPPWRPEGGAGDAGLVSIPLIIPPVRNKRYDAYGNLFGGLWKQSEDRLAEADEIIVIGYSFPETDVQAEALFKKAFMARRTMPTVVIVDPSPDRAAEKFSRQFGIDAGNLHVRAEKFTDTFDLASIPVSRPVAHSYGPDEP